MPARESDTGREPSPEAGWAAETEAPAGGQSRRMTAQRRGLAPSPHPDPSQRLRHIIFRGVRASELPRNLRQDFRQLYRFYLDEERRAELAAMGRLRRAVKLLSWLVKGLLARLSPGRRLALVAGFVLAALGERRLDFLGGITTDLRLWGFLVVVVVLMLELMDKLLARDEIELARQVQLALLPLRHPRPDGWSLWCATRPANDVGADLVDYLELPQGRFGVILADVAGKGLGAALLSSRLQAMLRVLAPSCPTLDALGTRLNTILYQDGLDNRFVTLFYFEVTPRSGRIRFLNAGHNPPLLLRAAGIEPVQACAIPLGMMEGTAYAEGALTLAEGEMLFVYSDGLTDARNASGEEFEMERLEALLPRLRGLTAERAAARILEEVDRFLGEERPHDDLSIVVAARTPPAAPAPPAGAPTA